MMIQKSYTKEIYENEFMYHILVGTDSSIERDIIEKHLAQAQEEYRSWLRGQTKPLPEAKIAYGVRVDGDDDFQKSKEKYNSIFCKCGFLIFFEAPITGWYKVKCPNPNCNHTQNVLVNKGEN